MKREAIADRLVNYCDAVAAFSIVNSLAFLLAMTETEVRCSLADRALLVYTGLVAFAIVLTIVVVWCPVGGSHSSVWATSRGRHPVSAPRALLRANRHYLVV